MVFLVFALLLTVSGLLASTWHAAFEETGIVRLVFLTPVMLVALLMVMGGVGRVLDPVSLGCSGNALKGYHCPDGAAWVVPFATVLSEGLLAAVFALPLVCAGFLIAVYVRRKRSSAGEP